MAIETTPHIDAQAVLTRMQHKVGQLSGQLAIAEEESDFWKKQYVAAQEELDRRDGESRAQKSPTDPQ
jgi:hypothetical protein